ncbi:MAG: antitoxin HicB [Bacteroidaceae bacterium]|nr:antitoxin HicB [Bacteroidaceae bacterium]
MKKLTVVVEYCENNLSAYINEVDGIIATGSNFTELKSNLATAVEEYIETCKECEFEIPEELVGEYALVYKYDLCSFLNAFSNVLSKSGLESLTGVNQKQLWHYAKGMNKPRKNILEKVQESIHEFGKDLMSVEFV